jgi:HPt (histidine-containing phosphotransfer) domain-containing protein
MPAGILLFVGEQAPASGEWRSPYPGDDWPIEHVLTPDEAAARVKAGGVEVLLVPRDGPVDAVRAVADAAKLPVVAVTSGDPADAARVLERVRIDAQLEKLKNLGGDEFVAEMVDLFLGDTPQQLGEALAALRAGELGGVQRRVHSLKSSAGNFGARALQELAFRAERLAAENRAEALPAALDAIGAAFERVRAYLQKGNPV